MEPMSLQHTLLIQIGISVWMKKEMKPFMIRQNCGVVKLENGLDLLKTTISELGLCKSLKDRLTHFAEKIGYELFVFLNKLIIRVNDDFELSDIKWKPNGVINEPETLKACLARMEKYDAYVFRSACIVCDEATVEKIWHSLSNDEKEYARSRYVYLVMPSYWIYKIEDRLERFPDECRSLMDSFDSESSVNVNMFRHSIMTNNVNAIYYFYQQLSENDRAMLQLPPKFDPVSVLNFALNKLPLYCFKYALSFFEKPVVYNKTVHLMIANGMQRDIMKDFIDCILRNVNIFNDLHYNIFRHFLYIVRHNKYATDIMDNLDFYALYLISKGKIDKFEYLSDMNPKEILQRQISNRLRHSRSLAIMSIIHFNKHTELLRSYLDWLAVSEEDRTFYNDYLEAIVNGVQYDLFRT